MSAARWAPADLAYCSNVHPGEDLATLLHNVGGPIAGVRRARGLDRQAGGLWLSRAAAAELRRSPDRLAEFRDALAAAGLSLVTINGFPAGNFHADVVKERVYLPDWSQAERLAYTLDLARILAACLPDGVERGTISTLPLGYASAWSDDQHLLATEALCLVAEELAHIADDTGCHIRLCLEMEPDCALERTGDLVRFFTEDLPAAAGQTGVPMAFVDQHLGACFDVCHQAVMFEDAAESLARLAHAGVTTGKIQVSSAIHVDDPTDPEVAAALAEVDEPRYLHQVTALSDGDLHAAPDLSPALADPTFPRDGPWRIHFHVPIQAETIAGGRLATTHGAITTVLDTLATLPGEVPHLEVETYTWEVLPDGDRPEDPDGLVRGIARELAWLEHAMAERSLLA